MTCSPYAGELPAREKIANAYAADHARAAERHLRFATARLGLQRLRQRFPTATDACLVPSFGTELRGVATALSAFWSGAGQPLFETICLVYPRPR